MVEIKTSKEIHPKIYAYTTPTVTSNDGWIKIGYTERDVRQRIKEQTHTAHIDADVLWTGDAAYTEEPDSFSDGNSLMEGFEEILKYIEKENKYEKDIYLIFNGNYFLGCLPKGGK